MRILTQGMIIYTEYSNFIVFKETLPNIIVIENDEHKSESRWHDFCTLFTKNHKTEKYSLNLAFPLQFQNFYVPKSKIAIPKIFLQKKQEEKYQKSLNFQFSIEMLKIIFEFLWQDIDFTLDSENNAQNQSNANLIRCHPIELSNIYQQISLKNQKRLQKGIYYSPQAEIQLLIISLISN